MTLSNRFSTIEPTALEQTTRRRFEQWLDPVVRDDDRHARLLNTLSLLEHIGSVKIARTQSGPAIDGEILQHLAEEARHADILKRMVRRVVGDGFDAYADDDLVAGTAARGYFSRLDATTRAFVRAHVPPAQQAAAAYNLVTWLIERRAMWLYPAYQELLEREASRVSVRSIIGEETRHLEDVCAALSRLDLPADDVVATLVHDEELHFARLVDAMLAHTPIDAGTI